TPSFPTFAAVNIVSRMGGAPQHPVGNGLLAEQFPEDRRGFAISAHISGGNVGTVVVAIVGAAMIAAFGWRLVVVAFGIPAVIVGVYVGGAISFVMFLLAGSSIAGLWLGILLMGLFSFAESPQLQALLADVANPRIRDASFSLYFTLAFEVGSLWTAVYGQMT